MSEASPLSLNSSSPKHSATLVATLRGVPLPSFMARPLGIGDLLFSTPVVGARRKSQTQGGTKSPQMQGIESEGEGSVLTHVTEPESRKQRRRWDFCPTPNSRQPSRFVRFFS